VGKSQRNKGAGFEREIASEFSIALGLDIEFKRNIGQARDGGNDLDVGPLVIECKRRASLTTIEKWIDQAQVAADNRMLRNPGRLHLPTVIARSDGGESLVIMRLEDFLILSGDEVRYRVQTERD
jgi:hypothetical protein